MPTPKSREESDEPPWTRPPNETVFERIERHANQGHGITLSRAETKEVADRLFGAPMRTAESFLRWQNESKIAELEERIAKLERLQEQKQV